MSKYNDGTSVRYFRKTGAKRGMTWTHFITTDSNWHTGATVLRMLLLSSLSWDSACQAPPGLLVSLRTLCGKDSRSLPPDNRDCGESSRCSDMKVGGKDVAVAVAQALLRRKVMSAYALEDMALDVERLLNHLSIRRAHIVGISMGGMIAQVAAVQSPNRVASLTSIASASGNPRTGLGRLKAVWALLRKPDNLNTKEGLRDYFTRVFITLSGPAYRPSPEELEDMLSKLDGLHYDPDGTSRQLLAILASGDRSWQLRRLTAPCADHSRHGGSAAASSCRKRDSGADSWLPPCGSRGHGTSIA